MNSQLVSYIAGASALVSVFVICIHNLAQALHALARALVAIAEAVKAVAVSNPKAVQIANTIETAVTKVDGVVTAVDTETSTIAAVVGAK
jgi:hypothetical protein